MKSELSAGGRIRSAFAVAFVFTVATVGGVRAADFVQVVHGSKPAPLEQLAASELVDILHRVFEDIEVRTGSDIADRKGTIILVGNPTSNPRITDSGIQWLDVSDQGIVIGSNSTGDHFTVGGGSPAATLWAVYELGHQLGIQYLLRGDLDPIQKRSFNLSGVAIKKHEPQIRQRGFETIGSGPFSFESWGLAGQRRLIRQLAKLKFNHLILKVEPWHPFVSYEFNGVSRSTATLFQGIQYPLTGDVVGKKAFAGARIFQHPDIEITDRSEQVFNAGRDFLSGVIREARQSGMTVSVEFRRDVFPAEFSRLLPGSTMPQPGTPYCIPADSSAGPANELFAASVQACFETYPEIDAVTWSRTTSGARRFRILPISDRQTAKAQLSQPDHESAQSEKITPDAKRDSRLSLTVHSRHLQLLPHTHSRLVGQTLKLASEKGWNSISIGPPMISEFDQDVVYISQALWHPNLESEASHQQLWATATENSAAAERLWQARQKLEHASELIMDNDPQFAFLGPSDSIEKDCSLITRHFVNAPIPEWWQEVTDDYTQYMIELYRAHGAIDGDSKPVLFYYAKRGEYVLEFLAAVKAVREAALAKEAGHHEEAIEHLETALESTYNCINTLSDVARDQSDRGLIAALNAYAYSPLVEKLEQLTDQE